MPARKRRPRRQVEPMPERTSGPIAADTVVEMPPVVVYLDPRTGRATHELSEAGYVFSRRPGDDWRDRLLAVWRVAATCPACGKDRKVLAALTGEAAVCDVLDDVAHLARLGCCTCAYAPLEG